MLVVVAALGLLAATVVRYASHAPSAERLIPRTISTVTAPDAARRAGPSDVVTPELVDPERAALAAYLGQDYGRALEGYRQAIHRHPHDSEALNNLGQVLVRLKRASEAVECFDRAIRLAPGKWSYHFNLAHAFGELGQWARAVSAYRIAANLFPGDYVTVYSLALALQRSGDDQSAFENVQQAIALRPQEPSFYLSLAASAERLGRRAETVAAYEEYLSRAGNTADAARARSRLATLTQPVGGNGAGEDLGRVTP